eukprot:Hpha_TRINITY_DN11969_c0_g1::TRINITY_DN11969_c0_g1_i1::g.20460::m.20460/K14803/PTC2_3; protein phosphatase PTC2/3
MGNCCGSEKPPTPGHAPERPPSTPSTEPVPPAPLEGKPKTFELGATATESEVESHMQTLMQDRSLQSPWCSTTATGVSRMGLQTPMLHAPRRIDSSVRQHSNPQQRRRTGSSVGSAAGGEDALGEVEGLLRLRGECSWSSATSQVPNKSMNSQASEFNFCVTAGLVQRGKAKVESNTQTLKKAGIKSSANVDDDDDSSDGLGMFKETAPTTMVPLEVQSMCFQVAVAESRGARRTMEDAACVVLRPDNEEDLGGWGYFGVFDGHGGDTCSKFCSDAFTRRARASDLPLTAEQLTKACIVTDEEWLTNHAFEKLGEGSERSLQDCSGSTGTMAVIWPEGEDAFRVRAANVGDSRVVVVRREGGTVRAEALTEDQKPEDPAEEARIEEAGGWVSMGRVNGILSVARAFGDAEFKEAAVEPENQIVTCMPVVTEPKPELLRAGDIVVLCCDGVFEKSLTRQDVAEKVADALGPAGGCGVTAEGPARAARVVVEAALADGSMDNITVVVVALRRPPPEAFLHRSRATSSLPPARSETGMSASGNRGLE